MYASTSGKREYDTDWDKASNPYKPLQLLASIDKIILSQIEDQYPFAIVYKQKCYIYTFSQNTFSNERWN